jgi:hypothetical protein
LANIAVSRLRTLKVPWLPANERHIVIEVATALSEVIDKARASLKASQRVRESLLSELLTGEQAIPHSYSSRVEEVG